MKLRSESSRVSYIEDPLIAVTTKDIEELKNQVRKNGGKSTRLCAHKNIVEHVHEMIIAVGKETYVPPHRHKTKVESYHIIEGKAHLVLFSDAGKVEDVLTMGDPRSGEIFYSRVPTDQYHMFYPLSEFMVFHETTNGPFDRSETLRAPWAPAEDQAAAVAKFMKETAAQITDFLRTLGQTS